MSNQDWAEDAFHTQEEGASARPAETRQPQENEAGMEALLAESDYAFRSLRRGETVEGTIVRVDQDEVLVDVGMKSEGVIPSRELYTESDGMPPLHVGDRTLVYVINPEGGDGHAILSLRKAQTERSWRDIEDIYQRGAILEAPVVDFNKGGLIVDVQGVRGFVPVSQVLDLRNVTRQEGENEEVNQTLSQMDGRQLSLKIIEINRARNRLILSERAAVQEQRASRKDELMDQLTPGQIRRGVVSNVTSFGAFVDLGGADGLVHVSELSYNRVNHPSEVLRVGQQIDVAVLSVDRDTKKIALSLKKALPDPWTTVEQRYHPGQVVSVTITKLAKFGAFAKVEEGLEGLIHLSELADRPVQDAGQVVREGQPVDAKIIQIDSRRRRLGLSVRQAGGIPRASVQSFGEIDESSPFATEALSAYEAYAPEPEPASTEDVVKDSSFTASPESEPLASHADVASASDEYPAADSGTDETPLSSDTADALDPLAVESEPPMSTVEDVHVINPPEQESAPTSIDFGPPSSSSEESALPAGTETTIAAVPVEESTASSLTEVEDTPGEQASPAAEPEPLSPMPAALESEAAAPGDNSPVSLEDASPVPPEVSATGESDDEASGLQPATSQTSL